MKLKVRLLDPDGVLESIRNAIASGGEEVVVDVEIVSSGKPKFDRTAYMRELMRKRRANPKPAAIQTPEQPKPQIKKPRAKAEKPVQPPMPDIPEPLSTDEFRVAWKNWLDHRASKRLPVTPVAARLQLDELAGWGSVVAVESINQSIKGGWQSIRKPNENSSASRTINRNDGNSNGGFLSANSKAYVETTAQKVRARMQGFANGTAEGLQPGEVSGGVGDGGGGQGHP